MKNQQETIAELASAEEWVRRRAIQTLSLTGRMMSRDTVERWERDAEFASILLRDALITGGKKHGELRATVGIATTPETFQKIRAANGMPRLADVPPDQDAAEFELHFTGTDLLDQNRSEVAIRLDILTTRRSGGEGAIAKFLTKFGEGIQQVEYEVTDVNQATHILADRFGIKAIYPETRAGADGTRVNFFLVPTASGEKILIELVELARPAG
ncbi:MAG: hypothetical protein WAM91_15655 [Candidatus Acidiferrales bacterium]